MIDLHSHVLPGLDDGPRETEGSVAMARAAEADGIRTIVATPHIDHVHDVAVTDVLPSAVALRGLFASQGVGVELLTGGEVAVSRVIGLSDAELRTVALGSSTWILLECPLRPAGSALEQTIFDLRVRGFSILLAHPERSPDLMRDPGRVAKLVEAGALCSVTASSLTGAFGSTVRKFALRLLDEGLLHNLASDAHDARRRPLSIGEAVGIARERRGEAFARWVSDDVPRALLADAQPPPAPESPSRSRSSLGGLLRRRRAGR